MTWQRAVHYEKTWGTIITFDVRDPVLPEKDLFAARDEAVRFLHLVRDIFSTFEPTSLISLVRSGVLQEQDVSSVEYHEVAQNCLAYKKLTHGYFDPWLSDGGVDFSGYVKGWAAQRASDIFSQYGFFNTAVNAAGDVYCGGFQSENVPWQVGIQHPNDKENIMGVMSASNRAVCTSGIYLKGNHIVQAFSPTLDVPSILSATVSGPDGGGADALATALVVAGATGRAWFSPLPTWSVILVTSNNEVLKWEV